MEPIDINSSARIRRGVELARLLEKEEEGEKEEGGENAIFGIRM